MPVGASASDVRLHFGGTRTVCTGDIGFLFSLGLYLLFLRAFLFVSAPFEDDSSGNDLVDVISSKLSHKDRLTD